MASAVLAGPSLWLGMLVMALMGGRSYESYVDDLRQLADSLGVRQFFMIGVSGGGPYAYAAAALLPERVLGVVTISTITQAGALDTHCILILTKH